MDVLTAPSVQEYTFGAPVVRVRLAVDAALRAGFSTLTAFAFRRTREALPGRSKKGGAQP